MVWYQASIKQELLQKIERIIIDKDTNDPLLIVSYFWILYLLCHMRLDL